MCLVEGGDPEPRVSWWREGQLFDGEGDPSTYDDVLQNTLVISSLDRSFHDEEFECRAINNNVTEPPRSGRHKLSHYQKNVASLSLTHKIDVEGPIGYV